MKTLKFIISAALFVLFSANFFAQAPNAFSYQAVVRNASNNLVINAPVGVKFSILQGSATGTAVYSETQNTTTNTNGLLTTTIGSGTVVSGNFANINWAVGPYFLKTEMDPAGGTSYSVNSTTQFNSVPYAQFANVAKNSPYNNNVRFHTSFSTTGTTGGNFGPSSVWYNLDPANVVINTTAGTITFNKSGLYHFDIDVFCNISRPESVDGAITPTFSLNYWLGSAIKQINVGTFTMKRTGYYPANTSYEISGNKSFNVQVTAPAIFKLNYLYSSASALSTASLYVDVSGNLISE